MDTLQAQLHKLLELDVNPEMRRVIKRSRPDTSNDPERDQHESKEFENKILLTRAA